jgi:hypothetical protein
MAYLTLFTLQPVFFTNQSTFGPGEGSAEEKGIMGGKVKKRYGHQLNFSSTKV